MKFLLSLQTLVLCCHGWSIKFPAFSARSSLRRRGQSNPPGVIRCAEDDQLMTTAVAWEEQQLSPPTSSLSSSFSGDDRWRAVPAVDQPPLIETLRWCRNFVLPLNLCPWAAASLQSDNVKDLKLYSVKNANDMEAAVYSAARLFHDSVVQKDVDPSVAISFVICEDLSWEFADFYDWFCALEEDFWDEEHDNNNGVQNHVTLAPFHPDWMFQSDDDMPSSSASQQQQQQLQFEKKSPYPTVTLVWTAVIDAAGPAVTNKIATHNEATLCSKTMQELSTMYQQGVYLIDR